MKQAQILREQASLNAAKVLNADSLRTFGDGPLDEPVLLVLAAGKGTRFGAEPKCIQPVAGEPLASHSINAFRQISSGPVICVVGYESEQVVAALGSQNTYVVSAASTAGTGYAVFESFSVGALFEHNPLVIITMGDRVVPTSTYRRLIDQHLKGNAEAALTFLTARHDPPGNLGKGRILRDGVGNIIAIREQRDIDEEPDPDIRQQQQPLAECNCPLYLGRARTLHAHLGRTSNNNAQQQFYLTDIIATLHDANEELRSVTVSPEDKDYGLLCADVTRKTDLARLERAMAAYSCDGE